MGRVVAGKVSDISDGKIHKVSIDGRDIAVVSLEGEYFAFDETCTHAGAGLSEGKIDGCKVVCGWHGAEFDCKTGKLEKFPAKIRDLQAYGVTVESDDVLVEV